jgi:glucose/arabinose dehydrogenase
MLRYLATPRALVLIVAFAAAALLAFLTAEQAKAPPQDAKPTAITAGVATGFQDRLYATAPGATALAFLPDDRLLVTDRSGLVRLHGPGTTNTSRALDISDDVCSNSERGLLGIAADPNFGANGYVYLYYTFNKFGTCPDKQPARNNPVNRVSRFEMVGDTIDFGTEEVLIDNIPSPNGNHNAGDLHFGKDGKLYVSTGDGACDYASPTRCQPENDASRDKNVLLGKILRVNTDGTIPADNPYADNANGVRCGQLTTNNASGGSHAALGQVCRETYAMGFRNPFRFAMDPDASGVSLRVNDVGGARIEEVDQVRSGGDYGWNCREGTLTLNTTGKCEPAPRTLSPIHQYHHNTGCSSITGGAFVPDGAGWPSSYRDAYLYGDYACDKIFSLKPKSGGGYSRTLFASGLQSGPVSFAFRPGEASSDGALYYTTYTDGGQVRRIAPAVNKAPVASVKATPSDPETGETFGPTPLNVTFDAVDSTDAENDPLTYEWDFGDPGSANNTASGSTANHTYNSAGKYTVRVTVSDNKGNSDTAAVDVYAGNTAAPQPVINPSTPTTFEANQEIALSGSASDGQDDVNGQDVELKWEVIRHHTAPNEHTHPSILDPNTNSGASVRFFAPEPEDLFSTNPDGNYLEVRLTATDSQGLSKTVSQDLRPETTGLTFETEPTNLYVIVNGQRVRAPRTILAWENSNLNLHAPAQTRDGRRYVFRNWSDGEEGSRRTIVTPQDSAGYVARFRPR